MQARGLFNRRPRSISGFSLIETVIAVTLTFIVAMSLIALMRTTMISLVKSRGRFSSEGLAQEGISILKNMDFYLIVATAPENNERNAFRFVDSALPNYGLAGTWGTGGAIFPYVGELDRFLRDVKAAKFTRFKIDVQYMRRDKSDSNNDGSTTGLIPFQDTDHDNVDDFDPNLFFFDCGGGASTVNLYLPSWGYAPTLVACQPDGDFNEKWLFNGREMPEVPDTDIKWVVVQIYKGNQLAAQQDTVINQKQFTGLGNMSLESKLSINISTPSEGEVLYQRNSTAQQNSFALAITASYPGNVPRLEADTTNPMPVLGITTPAESVQMYVLNSQFNLTDVVQADNTGNLAATAPLSTGHLTEGLNTIFFWGYKGAFMSPLAQKNIIYDIRPPKFSNPTPPDGANPVPTLTPYVAITFLDDTISTNIVSGVCPAVLTMKVTGGSFSNTPVQFLYDAPSGRLRWVTSSANLSVPALQDNTWYDIFAEGGDWAGYKAKFPSGGNWRFKVKIPNSDTSPPVIDNNAPTGTAASGMPVIQARILDPESGVDPSSLVMKVDGVPVSGAVYDPFDGTLVYTPSADLAPGSHTVSVDADHYASTPPADVHSSLTWTFNVS